MNKLIVRLFLTPTALCLAIATIGLAACSSGEEELPLGAYGRAVGHEWACKHYEGLQRINELSALGDIVAMKSVAETLWASGSCISFSKGDPVFYEGERKQGFLKVGPKKSEINYFADYKLLYGAR